MRSLSEGTEEERRQAAWRTLPDRAGFITQNGLGAGDWDVEVRDEQSRMATLIEVLQGWEGDTMGHETGLDLLYKSLADGGDRPIRERYLARTIPGLVVRSRLLGSKRPLDRPAMYAREILATLAEVMASSNNPSVRDIVIELARPYLPLEPYDGIFQTVDKQPVPTRSMTASTDPSERALECFTDSLDRP